MARFNVAFADFHDPVFLQGTNLGTKVNAKQRGCVIHWDTELNALIIQFKGKVSLQPLSNVISSELVNSMDIGIEPHPALKILEVKETEQEPLTDEAREAAAHRAEVRARSANANLAIPTTQNDSLIQQSRAAASKNPQVENPTKPTHGSTGKNKFMSHDQLRAQLAKEAKDVKPV